MNNRFFLGVSAGLLSVLIWLQGWMAFGIAASGESLVVIRLDFERFTPGRVARDSLRGSSVQTLEAARGQLGIAVPTPEMSVPASCHKVLLFEGDPEGTAVFRFSRPINGFSLTRAGSGRGASLPRWRVEAVGSDGKVLAFQGEDRNVIDPKEKEFSLSGKGIVLVRLQLSRPGPEAHALPYLALASLRLSWIEESKKPPPVQPPPALAEVRGRVTKAAGSEVTLAVGSTAGIQTGDRVIIIEDLPGLKEAGAIATGKVTAVDKGQVVAVLGPVRGALAVKQSALIFRRTARPPQK